MPRACDPHNTKGNGICTLGVQSCVDHKDGSSSWGECKGAAAPGTEVCDAAALDEDCDGFSNEGCACQNGATKACGTDVGICEAGVNTCKAGAWSSACEGGKSPKKRDCSSSADNDCDGFADNLADGVCQCKAGATQSCLTTGLGVCRAGTQTCVVASDRSSSEWGKCTSVKSPSKELCNSDKLDENCDGSVNEGCECTNGEGKTCNDGLSCTTDTCKDGACEHKIAANSCVIGGSCYSDGEKDGGNVCRACDASASQTEWRPSPAATVCETEESPISCSGTCGGSMEKTITTTHCSGSSTSCNGDKTSTKSKIETCDATTMCSDAVGAPSCKSSIQCSCSGSKVLYDANMDLCWQNPPTFGRREWAEAKSFCDDLNFEGSSDWRLPNVDELFSIIRGCRNGVEGGAELESSCATAPPECAKNASCTTYSACNDCDSLDGPDSNPPGCYWVPQLSGPCNEYWSSTRGNWTVWYSYGSLYEFSHPLDTAEVRCVRGGG